MSKDTLLILAAAIVGVVAVAYLTRKKTGTVTAGPLSGQPGVSEIANTALPGQAGWAWRYFTDGTSIDPAGNYYVGGNLVYAAGGAQ